MSVPRTAPARLRLVGVVLLVLGGSGLAGAASRPLPGLGVRLLDAPSNRADDPRARVYVVDRVSPGASFTRHVEVTNGDPAPMDVLLYPATASIQGGGFSVGDRGAPGLVPPWVTVSPTSAHLAPGGRVTVTATFRVPQDAPPGEVYGAIVAERPASRSGQTVSVALRSAIRVYLSVGGGGEPPSDFTVDSLTAGRDGAGHPYVLAAVHNTGGRALDMSGALRLTHGPGGLSAGPFPAALGTTLGIGQTEPVKVLLDKALPDGPWTATLDLASGLVKRRVEGAITFPAHPSEQSSPVHPKRVPLYQDQGVVAPFAAVLLVLAALGLLGLLLLGRRRRRHADR